MFITQYKINIDNQMSQKINYNEESAQSVMLFKILV